PEFSKAYRTRYQKFAAVTEYIRLLGMFHRTSFYHRLIDIRRRKPGRPVYPVRSEKTFCKIIFLEIDVGFVSNNHLGRRFEFAADQDHPEPILRELQSVGNRIGHKDG